MTGGLRNLPGWIERIALDMVSMAYQARDRDRSLTSLTVGPTSFAWGTSDRSREIEQRILALAVPT